MADKRDGPSLELPSLTSVFRRTRRAQASTPSEPTDPVQPIPPVDPPTEPVRPQPPPIEPTPPVRLPGAVVALLTGAVVGLALVGLTSGGLNACSAMRGTSSCGKPGVLLLLAFTVAVVLLGALVLRLLGVDSPGSTSFLGVGLLVVLVLLALLPVIDDWWMVVAVPLVAMLTFLAAWWVTTTYVEPGERMR